MNSADSIRCQTPGGQHLRRNADETSAEAKSPELGSRCRNGAREVLSSASSQTALDSVECITASTVAGPKKPAALLEIPDGERSSFFAAALNITAQISAIREARGEQNEAGGTLLNLMDVMGSQT